MYSAIFTLVYFVLSKRIAAYAIFTASILLFAIFQYSQNAIKHTQKKVVFYSLNRTIMADFFNSNQLMTYTNGALSEADSIYKVQTFRNSLTSAASTPILKHDNDDWSLVIFSNKSFLFVHNDFTDLPDNMHTDFIIIESGYIKKSRMEYFKNFTENLILGNRATIELLNNENDNIIELQKAAYIINL